MNIDNENKNRTTGELREEHKGENMLILGSTTHILHPQQLHSSIATSMTTSSSTTRMEATSIEHQHHQNVYFDNDEESPNKRSVDTFLTILDVEQMRADLSVFHQPTIAPNVSNILTTNHNALKRKYIVDDDDEDDHEFLQHAVGILSNNNSMTNNNNDSNTTIITTIPPLPINNINNNTSSNSNDSSTSMQVYPHQHPIITTSTPSQTLLAQLPPQLQQRMHSNILSSSSSVKLHHQLVHTDIISHNNNHTTNQTSTIGNVHITLTTNNNNNNTNNVHNSDDENNNNNDNTAITATRHRMPHGHWKNEENIFLEALKYNTRSEFQKGCESAYDKAREMKILDKVCVHMKRSHMTVPRGHWTLENIYMEAIKYPTRATFEKYSNGAYEKARELKIMDKVCAHMKPPVQLSPQEIHIQQLQQLQLGHHH